MKFAVCKGQTVHHGVAKKVGNETIVENFTFSAGEPINLKDDKEHQRLLVAGVIRRIDEDPVDAVDIDPPPPEE